MFLKCQLKHVLWVLERTILFLRVLVKGTILMLCPVRNFSCLFFFCRLKIFFKTNFLKILSGISSECQTDWIQSVCKGYEQATLVGNDRQ